MARAYRVGHTGWVRFVVWIDGWQMQCCGAPFEVGQPISWTLSDEPDHEWLSTAVGNELATRITHSEDHHGDLPDDLPATQGSVIAITSTFCRFAPDTGAGQDKTYYPVPGSTVLRKVKRATGWEQESSDLQFNGYLVELRVADQER